MRVRKPINSTMIGIPIQRPVGQMPGPAQREQIFRTASERIQLSSFAFASREPEARVEIRYKTADYINVPLLPALAACYIDQIVSTLDYEHLGNVLMISYRKAENKPKHYIGVFVIDISKLAINYSLVEDPGIKAKLARAMAKLSVRIETVPFFVPDERLDLVDDMGIINSISEANDAVEFLARLREPRNKILACLADQLENKLKKTSFLRTAFLKKSEEIINQLLSRGEPARG